MERDQIQEHGIQAMDLDPQERMLEMRVQHEVQVAVLHSFDKAGFSMV
jgi:nitric oxide synthase oxygenase domain/subunit